VTVFREYARIFSDRKQSMPKGVLTIDFSPAILAMFSKRALSDYGGGDSRDQNGRFFTKDTMKGGGGCFVTLWYFYACGSWLGWLPHFLSLINRVTAASLSR
jgi:hypothetical protein